ATSAVTSGRLNAYVVAVTRRHSLAPARAAPGRVRAPLNSPITPYASITNPEAAKPTKSTKYRRAVASMICDRRHDPASPLTLHREAPHSPLARKPTGPTMAPRFRGTSVCQLYYLAAH